MLCWNAQHFNNKDKYVKTKYIQSLTGFFIYLFNSISWTFQLGMFTRTGVGVKQLLWNTMNTNRFLIILKRTTPPPDFIWTLKKEHLNCNHIKHINLILSISEPWRKFQYHTLFGPTANALIQCPVSDIVCINFKSEARHIYKWKAYVMCQTFRK